MGYTPKYFSNEGSSMNNNRINRSFYDNLLTNDKMVDVRAGRLLKRGKPTITHEEYIIRFFTRDIREKKMFEITEEDYKLVLNKNPQVYFVIYDIRAVPWKIRGPRDSVESVNKNIVEKISANFSGIEQILSNFTEYYQGT